MGRGRSSRSAKGAGEAVPGSSETSSGATEPEGVAAQPAAAANGGPTGDDSSDQLDQRVRAAAEEAEQRAIEEIEALEEDLERATEKAEGLQAELERTKATLNEALAKSGQAEGNVEKEVERRAAAEAEAERFRGELERLRSEIVERVREVVEDVAGKAPPKVEESPGDQASEAEEVAATATEAVVAADAHQPRRTRRLGWPLSVIVGAIVLAAGAGLVTGVTSADSEERTVKPARADQTLLTYERTLRREVTALDASRTSHLKRLRKAHSAGDQAAAAEDLATAHARAARSLGRASAPASVASEKDSVVSALRQAADTYRQLAAGAATRRPAAYEAGATAVRRAEAKLQHSLKADSSRAQ